MKILYTIFLMGLLTNAVYSQNFPVSNATWSVYDEKYFIDGDSILNSVSYTKYYLSMDSIITTGTFFALLREDTVAHKVFAVRAGETEEHLLYDFSLNINDTVTVYPLSFEFWQGPLSVYIEQIDSILIGGSYSKRFKINNYSIPDFHEEYWIQGIGSTLGIFNSGVSAVPLADIEFPVLLCFEKDGILLYDNPDFTDCYEHYPVGINEKENNVFSIYPNPADKNIRIVSKTIPENYYIYSGTGNEIQRGSFGKMGNSIDISALPAGIYVLIIEGKSSVSITRLSIVR